MYPLFDIPQESYQKLGELIGNEGIIDATLKEVRKKSHLKNPQARELENKIFDIFPPYETVRFDIWWLKGVERKLRRKYPTGWNGKTIEENLKEFPQIVREYEKVMKEW